MGASTFMVFEERKSIDDSVGKAFARATESAAYEHGHGGYTGTMAEKVSYVMIEAAQPGPIPYAEARAAAQRLIEEGDPRVDDKWGPAGVIRVLGGVWRGYDPYLGVDVEREYDGWLFFGWASD